MERPWSLDVSRAALAEGLATLAGLTHAPGAEAVLSHDGLHLLIELAGTSFTVLARGTWPGRARVAGSLLRGLARALPPGDTLRLRLEDGRLRLGSMSVPAQRQDLAPRTTIALPMDPALAVRLAVALAFTEAEIATAGLTDLVADAREEAGPLMASAVDALAPLGVTRADMEDFVTAVVRRQMPSSWRDRS